MTTVLKLGPADHGRELTLEEFLSGDYAEGHRYELIDGRLYVSPQANFPHDLLVRWLFRKLDHYAEQHEDVINYVSFGARVFVPDRDDVTCPEPDIAAYRKVPLHRPPEDVDWQNLSPILVVEVLSPDELDKDLVRNVELYFQVPSVREYWVLDTRQEVERPTLIAHRRYGKRWRVHEVTGGETYTTRLLPDFELVLDVRR
jgi:Uma2 family endonuclease